MWLRPRAALMLVLALAGTGAFHSFAGPEDTDLPPLDLAVLLSEAEDRNPEILALRSRLAAAAHVPSQAQALPDPTASLSYTNETLTDFTLGTSPDSNLTVSFVQEVPYPGKRRLAGDVARAEIEVGSRELEAARLRIRAEVKILYAELLRLDRTETILQESSRLLDSFLETARARYESGEGILENVLKAQTERTKLEAELTMLRQERRGAGVRLSALVARSSDSPWGSPLAPPFAERPRQEWAEQAALARSPGILALRAGEQRDEARLALARRNLKPDLMWGTAYMNRGGLDPMVMGMVGLRLPLYRKQKQAEAVVQTELELEAARRDTEAGGLRLLSEVRELMSRAERAETLLTLYAEGILPQARGALDSAAAAYSAGRTEFLTLLDDFLKVLVYEREQEAQRAEKVTALAALEAITGLELVRPSTEPLLSYRPGGTHE